MPLEVEVLRPRGALAQPTHDFSARLDRLLMVARHEVLPHPRRSFPVRAPIPARLPGRGPIAHDDGVPAGLRSSSICSMHIFDMEPEFTRVVTERAAWPEALHLAHLVCGSRADSELCDRFFGRPIILELVAVRLRADSFRGFLLVSSSRRRLGLLRSRSRTRTRGNTRFLRVLLFFANRLGG